MRGGSSFGGPNPAFWYGAGLGQCVYPPLIIHPIHNSPPLQCSPTRGGLPVLPEEWFLSDGTGVGGRVEVLIIQSNC